MIAPVQQFVSEYEYLHTNYKPDCDYLEGVLEERNLGQKDHSDLQGKFWGWFFLNRDRLKLKAFVEQRVRVGTSRYRIPDVCVVRLPEPDEQIFSGPPYIAIEILSPDDTFPRIQRRLDDFLKMGIPNVWLVEPGTNQAWRATAEGLLLFPDSVLRTTEGAVEVNLLDVIAL